jgi:hypothetical protein
MSVVSDASPIIHLARIAMTGAFVAAGASNLLKLEGLTDVEGVVFSNPFARRRGMGQHCAAESFS